MVLREYWPLCRNSEYCVPALVQPDESSSAKWVDRMRFVLLKSQFHPSGRSWYQFHGSRILCLKWHRTTKKKPSEFSAHIKNRHYFMELLWCVYAPLDMDEHVFTETSILWFLVYTLGWDIKYSLAWIFIKLVKIIVWSGVLKRKLFLGIESHVQCSLVSWGGSSEVSKHGSNTQSSSYTHAHPLPPERWASFSYLELGWPCHLL